MDETPAMASTLEEAYVLAIAGAAKHHHFEADAPEHALGEYVAAALDPLIRISAIVGDISPFGPQLYARLRSAEKQLLLLGALIYTVVETARELLCDEEALRTATKPAITRPLTLELASAAIRAGDLGHLDRGFELPDLPAAWEMIAFSYRSVIEMLAQALHQRSSLEELELSAVDALTAITVALVKITPPRTG